MAHERVPLEEGSPFGHDAIVLPTKGRPASEAPADLSGLAANALPWPMISFFLFNKRV